MILDVVKRASDALGLPFNHGPREFANINREIFPSVFLYPVTALDALGPINELISTYRILLDVHYRIDSPGIDPGEDKITEVIKVSEETAKSLIVAIAKDPEVNKVTQLRREPLYHFLAEDLYGWAIEATVEIRKRFTYCP